MGASDGDGEDRRGLWFGVGRNNPKGDEGVSEACS